MSSKNPLSPTNVFGPRRKPARSTRRDRRRGWEAGSAQVERLEERLALTLTTYAVPISSGHALLVMLDGQEDAYLTRTAEGELFVAGNSSFIGASTTRSQAVGVTETGVTLVGNISGSTTTIAALSGRAIFHGGGQSFAGQEVTFNVKESFGSGNTVTNASNLVAGSLRGSVTITGAGSLSYEASDDEGNVPLTIRLAGNWNDALVDTVTGTVDTLSGQVTLRFRKGNAAVSATGTTGTTQFATFVQTQPGLKQSFTIWDGHTIDDRLLVRLVPDESRFTVSAPVTVAQGTGADGWYAGYGRGSLAVAAEYFDVNATMSAASVTTGYEAFSFYTPGLPTRAMTVNRPLTAANYSLAIDGIDGDGNGVISQAERGVLRARPQGSLGSAGTFTLYATDADEIIESTLTATKQTHLFRSPQSDQQWQMTTTSPDTGFRTGSIVGDVVAINFGTDGGDGRAASVDSPHIVDINTNVTSLRVTAASSSSEARSFPVRVDINEANDLIIDATPESSVPLRFKAGGRITVSGAIATFGDLSLEPTTALILDAPVSTVAGTIDVRSPVVTGGSAITAGIGLRKRDVAGATTPADNLAAATWAAGTPAGPATISGPNAAFYTPLVVDEQTLARGDRLLVKDRPAPSQNGIYEVTSPITSISSLQPLVATTTDLGDTQVRLATTSPLGLNFQFTPGTPGSLATLGNIIGAAAGQHNFVLDIDQTTAFSVGDRVLVKNQLLAAQNGIYQVTVAPNMVRQLPDVTAATTGNLPAAYANGTGGIGATLTASTPERLRIDTVAVAVGARVLVKDQTTPAHNGFYVVTDAGTDPAGAAAGTPWVLTRTTDVLETGVGAYATTGPANGGAGFVVTTATPITVGTTAITFGAATRWQLQRTSDADSVAELRFGTSVRVTGGNANLDRRFVQFEPPVPPLTLDSSNLSYVENYFWLSGTNSGGLPTVDGATLSVGDLVLVKNQLQAADNGLYFVVDDGTANDTWILIRTDTPAVGIGYDVQTGSQIATWYVRGAGTLGRSPVQFASMAGATWELTRSNDADVSDELPLGTFVGVQRGTLNAGTGWSLQTPAPFTLDSTVVVFGQTQKQDAFVATAAPLPGVYDNETPGVTPATITGAAGSLILTVDGVRLNAATDVGRRVLVKDQANATENGLYVVAVPSDVVRQLADVRAATTTALTATYANNSPGVIASTLTGTGLLPLVDGVELAVGDRVLVQSYTGADAVRNGVYTVTRTGGESGANQDWTLTRASDMDAAPEFTVGTGVFVREGVAHGGTGLRLANLSTATVVVGTTRVAFNAVVAWQLVRASDAAEAGDLPYGFFVTVTNGATNAQTGWALGTDDPITLGTTPLDFYSASAPFVKGNGDLSIISTSGNLTVNSLVSATGDTVRLTASGATAAIGGTSRIAADRAELVAGGAISANGSVTTLVATSGTGITFDNSGALELEAVQTSTGNINVSAGGRITATAVRAGGTATGPTTPTGAFDIDLVFGAGLPSAVQAAMRSAADRWEQIIVGDIADFTDPVSGQLIDDIVVFVQAGLLGGPPSDGPSNTLANAGPTGLRPAGSTNQFIPYTAEVGIDTADYTQSDIVGIMIHELGHALGFTETAERLNLVSSAYVWTGTNATREYRLLLQPGATGVPMETDTTQFGPGSLYSHWSEQVLGNELMTPRINNAPNPLSRITVGAFEDMGYTVNYAAADAYPSSASVRPAAAVAGDGNISLTARAGNIDVVALTAEQDKVTLIAANGTISGLSPAAAWLDWTAKVAPEQSFYNDFQKLSANLTGAGSIIVNNPGAITLQDIRTADGNIFVTAGGTLTPVSVVAGGKGTVYLDYSGVGGNIAAGTITSNAASPRVLRKDPVRVATTAAIALNGTQTIDGVAVVVGDRVLVRNQANAAQNGIYVVAAGAWSRASDANQAEDLSVGVRVAVTQGTQKGDYECVRGSSLTLGTTALTFDRVKIFEISDIAPVRVATTAPITLATATVVDGVALATGDRVLVRRQADSAENGIYGFDGTGLVREADTFTYGALVVVTEGTQAGGYMVNFAGEAVTADSTPLRFDPVAVAITSATGITDGSVGTDKVDITAGTVRLVARDGSIGTVTNRLDLAADVLIASATASGLASLTSGANIYVGDSGDLTIANAFASGRVDVAAGGISGKLTAAMIETDAAGLVTLTAPGDIIVGTIGSIDPSRRAALVTLDAATGFLRNSPDGTTITADKVRLVSRNFTSFDVSKLDDVDIFSIKQTSAGALQATFDRATPVTFDDVTASGGNIAFVNNGTGDFLIGTGGINAGAFNGVSLATGGQIGGPLVGNQGKIAGGGLVSLTADTTIAALTSAGSLAAKITGTTAPGTISITETDSAQIGAAGIDAGGVGSLITLAAGGQLDGLGSTSGLVRGDSATVTARTGIGLKTELAALAASTASGVIVVRENDDLMVGAAGITATSGNVSISTGESIAALSASLFYDRSTATSGLITGSLVTLDARKPGTIDVATKATEIAGSTVAGAFFAVDSDGVTIGRAGISAGRTVRVATTAALTATYANNTPGLVPATLTATGFGALAVDGVSLALGDRVLVKNQTTQLQNGIYSVTAVGSSTTRWVLTRAADADTTAEMPDGTVVNVSEGSLNGSTAYLLAISGQLGTAVLTASLASAPGTDISISTVKGDILTPSTYATAEGVLAGDTVTLLAAGSLTARTDTRSVTAAAGTGNATIAEKSAVSLAQVWSSAVSGTGSVTVTAGGDITSSDVRARGTRGSVTLRTTAGDISTVSGGAILAPEAITLDAARRISAKDANIAPIQAPTVNLTARGVDDASTSPATPALDAEVVAKTLSASAPNGSVRVVVESTDTLVLGAAAGTAAKTSLTAAGSVDISSAGGDVVVFSAPQARAGASVVRAASTANLAGAAAGVTLTASANGSINSSGIDGVKTLAVGDRVLLTKQTAASQNGIYVVTSLGSSGAKWTLTRAADSDTAAEYPVGSLTRVTDGTSAGKVFALTAGSVGTTALTLADQTANLTTRINTLGSTKTVSYVVSATAGTNATGGTLGNMIDLAQSNAASPTKAALVFSSTLTAPIFLTQQLPVLTKPLVIDGSQRLSPTTLARSTSASPVAVNGSGITIARNGSTLATSAVVDGFTIAPTGSNAGATIANLALGGFTRGAAVKIESGTGATVRNSSFGLTTTNTKLANQTGIAISGGANATLSANTIGYSTSDAVNVSGGTGTAIRGNFIGTNATGSLKIGNTGNGVRVSGNSTVVSIGGLTTSDRNVITNNGNGITITDSAFASLVGNSIYANGTASTNGIVSSSSAALAAPVITSTSPSMPRLAAAGGNTSLTLSGTLPGTGVRHIDVYGSPATTTGNQGQVYLGRITVQNGATSFSGTVTFTSSLGVAAGWKITATVTSTVSGNPVTSVFSAAVAAVTGTGTGTGTGGGGTGTGGTGTGGSGTGGSGTGGGGTGNGGVVSNPRPPSTPRRR
jgi:hypothetical protein